MKPLARLKTARTHIRLVAEGLSLIGNTPEQIEMASRATELIARYDVVIRAAEDGADIRPQICSLREQVELLDEMLDAGCNPQ
jgi:hypothetical protein